MEKCGICKGDVERQPHVTKDGKCDICGEKLALEKKK